jgi:hypothetical protein
VAVIVIAVLAVVAAGVVFVWKRYGAWWSSRQFKSFKDTRAEEQSDNAKNHLELSGSAAVRQV